jgi:hypothetical protein
MAVSQIAVFGHPQAEARLANLSSNWNRGPTSLGTAEKAIAGPAACRLRVGEKYTFLGRHYVCHWSTKIGYNVASKGKLPKHILEPRCITNESSSER